MNERMINLFHDTVPEGMPRNSTRDMELVEKLRTMDEKAATMEATTRKLTKEFEADEETREEFGELLQEATACAE